MLIVHFTDVCLVAKSLNRSEAKGDLVLNQNNVAAFKENFILIMPSRYCSLSQQGHLQPHSKSRA